jgi:ATP phosphoribosyltransferase
VTALNGLRIAVPRGALLGETLDVLDRLGVDTAEVRGNDRKLLFEDSGIVTMRPSDVPTYVEAGAADIGITGKDVLVEQAEREVYELHDLGFGRCRMILATVAGDDPAAEALRRLGMVRVATKYPKLAAAYFERTGRQAEIVEVKGSVELAPADGARGGHRRSHRDRHDAARERAGRAGDDLRGDRAADRQPGGAQAQGRRDRRPARPCAQRAECAPVIAIVDYGMGNRRSVEKALQRVGADPVLTADPDELRRAEGSSSPAWARSPRRCAACARSGSTTSSRAAEVPVIGLCLGMQLLFESSDEHEGERGSGLLPGRVVRLDTQGLKLPHIGWNMVRWRRESPLVEGCRPRRPSTTCTRSRRSPRTTRWCSAPASTARRSSRSSSAARLRGAVPPREVVGERAAGARELREVCRGVPAR